MEALCKHLCALALAIACLAGVGHATVAAAMAGAMAGHGFVGSGGQLNPAGGGRGQLNPAGGGGQLRGAGPMRRDPLDREGRFDRGFGRHHGVRRFGYPVCFAYPYCPYPVAPCVWRDGFWTTQPGYDVSGAPTIYPVWVPPGCY